MAFDFGLDALGYLHGGASWNVGRAAGFPGGGGRGGRIRPL
jgi:hypothetical protein